ncbi:alpha/beta fold hydrolase [Nocardioides sp.]|uniref:alpha/beta hydrolase family protein n=1 Tax=Nocardioides sp. TaxID=35761 RepID=UPI0039E62D16
MTTTTVLARAEGTSYTLTTWPTDAPAAPVVVIAAAMGMPAGYYHRFGAALAAAGINAALPELRGHEESGGRVPGRDYDFGYADMVEDLATAVEATRERFPGAPVVLLGHSMGGQIAMMYAARQPDTLAGLALVASSTPYWRHWSPALLVGGRLFPALATVLGHFPGQRFRFAGRESRGTIRDWGHLARTGRFVVGEDGLADVRLPVLAISVEGDRLGPARAVDALVAKIPNATVEREHLDIEGIDHFKWVRRPEVVVPRIHEWIVGAVD